LILIRVGIFDEPINQPLVAGDIILYWHPMFVCGDKQGRRTSKILEVDPELSLPIIMDNGDRLGRYQSVQRLEYVDNGQMKKLENPTFAWVEEHQLSYSVTKEYAATRQTGESIKLGQVMQALQRQSIEVAQQHGLPVDVFHGVSESTMAKGETTNYESLSFKGTESDRDDGKPMSRPPELVYQVHQSGGNESSSHGGASNDKHDSEETAEGTTANDEEFDKDADNISIDTDDINYHDLVVKGLNNRAAMEATARKGQKKQADAVSKARMGKGGEVIGKGTMCTIPLDGDRNDFTPKHLPVMVGGTYYYTASNTIRYKICTENGIIEKTFGREQLTPHPELTPESMGINYSKLDKFKVITLTQAGEMYSKLGGKLSYCRCKSDCSKSKQCKCKKMNKFCGQHCHGGAGKNSLCRNCPPKGLVYVECYKLNGITVISECNMYFQFIYAS